MSMPLAVRIDVINKGFILALVIGLNAAAIENDESVTRTYWHAIEKFTDWVQLRNVILICKNEQLYCKRVNF